MTDPLDRVRALCLALPGAVERPTRGQPGWQIEKGRYFAYFWDNHLSDGETHVLVKTGGADEQVMLIEADPGTYRIPPYWGPSGWIALRLDTPDGDWDRVGDRIAISWELVAPARLLEAGGR